MQTPVRLGLSFRVKWFKVRAKGVFQSYESKYVTIGKKTVWLSVMQPQSSQ